MNQLTICLITRGRKQFLDSCLKSLELVNNKGLANILIIDNGAGQAASHQLEIWSKLNRAEYIRYEENETRANKFWEVLREKDLKWVVFPGDDDIIRPESISNFLKAIQDEPTLNAVCFNIQALSEGGLLEREIHRPVFDQTKSQEFQIAAAFHEPPFIWPALFINIQAIPLLMPTSRFVFDWWVGIQLILQQGVKSIDEVAVNYRRHPQQESNLANLRRKSFEASFWLSDVIESDAFGHWLGSRSEEQIKDFWSQMISSAPIYGEEHYGFLIQLSISRKILMNPKFRNVAENIAGEFATNQGVYFKRGDVRSLLPPSFVLNHNSESNLSFRFANDVCQNMQQASRFLIENSTRDAIVVGCEHSKNSHNNFVVNCIKLIGLDSDQIADSILFEYVKKLETKGALRMPLTENERRLIYFLRKIQSHLSEKIKEKIKKNLELSIHGSRK